MRIADIRQIQDVAFPNNGEASEAMGGRAPENFILIAQSVHDAVVGKSCKLVLGMFLSGAITCAEELGITKLQLQTMLVELWDTTVNHP